MKSLDLPDPETDILVLRTRISIKNQDFLHFLSKPIREVYPYVKINPTLEGCFNLFTFVSMNIWNVHNIYVKMCSLSILGNLN